MTRRDTVTVIDTTFLIIESNFWFWTRNSYPGPVAKCSWFASLERPSRSCRKNGLDHATVAKLLGIPRCILFLFGEVRADLEYPGTRVPGYPGYPGDSGVCGSTSTSSTGAELTRADQFHREPPCTPGRTRVTRGTVPGYPGTVTACHSVHSKRRPLCSLEKPLSTGKMG
eukprot:694668-Rhodomonas_salina.3